jgi:hypothetical protein
MSIVFCICPQAKGWLASWALTQTCEKKRASGCIPATTTREEKEKKKKKGRRRWESSS